MNIGRESETVEFKKSTSELNEGVVSIASILNKHGKGALCAFPYIQERSEP